MNQSKISNKHIKYMLFILLTIGIGFIFIMASSLINILDNNVVISTVYKYEVVEVINKDIINDEYVVEVETNNITGEIYSKELYDEVKLGDKIEVPIEKHLNSKGELIGSKIIGLK